MISKKKANKMISKKKANKKIIIKGLAREAIERVLPPWKRDRHEDEKELGLATTLTDAEYLGCLQKVQSIRDASNVYESSVNSIVDGKEIDDLCISYNIQEKL